MMFDRRPTSDERGCCDEFFVHRSGTSRWASLIEPGEELVCQESPPRDRHRGGSGDPDGDPAPASVSVWLATHRVWAVRLSPKGCW